MVDRSQFTHRMVNSERVPLTESEIDRCVAAAEKSEKEAPARAWAAVRAERNKRLLATDWRASSDLTLGDWAGYRQALRDYPSTLTDAQAQEFDDLEWPSEPS